MLEIQLAAVDSGPVMVLSGEADETTFAELNQVLDSQVSAGVWHLTVDVSGLRFADSAAIHALMRTDRSLKQLGGALEVLHPQPAVARILSLMGVDKIITVRTRTNIKPGPEGVIGTGVQFVALAFPGRPSRRSGPPRPR